MERRQATPVLGGVCANDRLVREDVGKHGTRKCATTGGRGRHPRSAASTVRNARLTAAREATASARRVTVDLVHELPPD